MLLCQDAFSDGRSMSEWGLTTFFLLSRIGIEVLKLFLR